MGEKTPIPLPLRIWKVWSKTFINLTRPSTLPIPGTLKLRTTAAFELQCRLQLATVC